MPFVDHAQQVDHFCVVEEGGTPRLREVKVGLHNDKLIEVREGLKEGEVVFLYNPEGAAAGPEGNEEEPRKEPDAPAGLPRTGA